MKHLAVRLFIKVCILILFVLPGSFAKSQKISCEIQREDISQYQDKGKRQKTIGLISIGAGLGLLGLNSMLGLAYYPEPETTLTLVGGSALILFGVVEYVLGVSNKRKARFGLSTVQNPIPMAKNSKLFKAGVYISF